MPTVRIPPGVVRGESRAVVPGRWYETSLVRWREGNICPLGGWDRITPAPFGSVPRGGHVWTDKNYTLHRAVLCDGNVYRQGADSVWFEITPADLKNAENAKAARGYGSGNVGLQDYGDDDELRGGTAKLTYGLPVAFTLDNWNDELLFGTSADGRIFVWDPENPMSAPLPAKNVPTLVQAFLVTDEHHLMTFGGDGFPNRVAWSDQGFRNRFDYANVTGQAGFFDLEGAGTIYTAKKVPGGILVFTQTAVWLGTYSGNPYYYGFKKIAEHLSPVSPQAVSVAAGKAFWMIKSGFAMYAAGVVQPLPCTLDLDPSESMDTYMAPRRVCAGFNGVHNEIIWFYPSAKQNTEVPENDRYVIYNFSDGWWCDGMLSRSFFVASPIEGFPFAGSAATKMVYQHERGYLDDGNSRLGKVYAETGSISFDDAENVWTVTRGEVDARNRYGADNKSVRYRFYGTTVRGKKFKELANAVVRPNGYIGPMFSAKEFSYRVESVADVPWSVGAFKLTATKRGPV